MFRGTCKFKAPYQVFMRRRFRVVKAELVAVVNTPDRFAHMWKLTHKSGAVSFVPLSYVIEFGRGVTLAL